MFTKKISGIVLVIVLTLIGCSSTPDATAAPESGTVPTQVPVADDTPMQQQPTLEPVSLKIGVRPFLSHAPFLIAQQEGFFEAQGLDVELVSFRSSAEMIPLLLVGDLDVIIITVTPAAFNAAGAGGEIKFVANKGWYDPDHECVFSGWTARTELLAEGGLDDLANLEGLKIGTLPGSLIEYSLDRLLAQGGLTQEDIQLVSIAPQSSLMEGLGTGAIDIAGQGEPWIFRTRQAGYADVLISHAELIPDYDLGLIVYGPNMLQNTEVGQRFMLAWLNTVEYFSQGKTERNIELSAEYSGLTPEEVTEACWQPIKADGQINVEAIMDFQEWALAKGYLDAIVDPDQFWDSQFIDYANENME